LRGEIGGGKPFLPTPAEKYFQKNGGHVSARKFMKDSAKCRRKE
jgi:hypothetical protein